MSGEFKQDCEDKYVEYIIINTAKDKPDECPLNPSQLAQKAGFSHTVVGEKEDSNNPVVLHIDKEQAKQTLNGQGFVFTLKGVVMEICNKCLLNTKNLPTVRDDDPTIYRRTALCRGALVDSDYPNVSPVNIDTLNVEIKPRPLI